MSLIKVNIMGIDVPLDAAENLMDDEIREQLHQDLDMDSAYHHIHYQQFVDAYCELHFKKFNEEFIVN